MPNTLKVKTHFVSPKFLVYNDGFHSGWNALMDGKRVELERANIAFKGIWVPLGDHRVDFQYGKWWQYALNYFLLFIFYFVFIKTIQLNLKRAQST